MMPLIIFCGKHMVGGIDFLQKNFLVYFVTKQAQNTGFLYHKYRENSVDFGLKFIHKKIIDFARLKRGNINKSMNHLKNTSGESPFCTCVL